MVYFILFYLIFFSIPSVRQDAPVQLKRSNNKLMLLWEKIGRFLSRSSGGDDLEEALLGSNNSQRKSDCIKRDIKITLLAMCISLMVRFLWLALTIAGDLLASDSSQFSQGACSDRESSIFLLFVIANSTPWVICVVHVITEPLPVFITVWTMGKVSGTPTRLFQ
jgi:hypothetical protein